MGIKNLQLVILFGSHAKQTAGALSDVDIALLGNTPLSLEEKFELEDEIVKKFVPSSARIDLIDLWTASPLLQYQVAQTGKLLYGNEFNFTRFKVLAWKRYQDTAKFRRIREKVLRRTYAK